MKVPFWGDENVLKPTVIKLHNSINIKDLHILCCCLIFAVLSGL